MFINRINKGNCGYFFIAPFFIVFLLFGLYPILYSFYLSLTNWDGLNDPEFIGLANYARAIIDPLFLQSLFNTFFIWIVSVIPQLTVSLVLAVILTNTFLKGKDFFRAVYFFPNIVTAASLGLLVSLMFDWQTGSVNQLLMSIGFLDQAIDWKNNALFMQMLVSAILFFQYFGYSMLIYIAGLQGISPEYAEAAKVDGASKIQIFFKITVPLLKPIIIFQVITSLIGGVQIFDQPYMLTEGSGSPNHATLTSVMYLYRTAFEQGRFGYGATIAFCLFVVIVSLSVISYLVSRNRSKIA
ncbi:carbohydrate ABC transporter permease [Shouchella clausii]|uniref:ABC transporter n=1 Tax=Shouchella clausii TaxID=79880 RepID=A0A268RYE5_SHOCL|nr:sugar ABC transporter permease [Shouchella clausii]PAD43285.1 ABC transporter [Bacillus sp. 7520-S]MBU8598424.1 sugar ABC transporter permease [Shouchella clausii]MCY1105454.1 sugar ABC transporter permease [Shouchella clausii]MEB5482179.1 sugar ABC transporter permease [Shouchella clausii]MED4160700.1 sugar ABC transporter permease [Shouchella clausii]